MITKEERKECWIDQIKTAIFSAGNAVKYNPEDGGTCNLDSAMVKEEKWFTYDETFSMFLAKAIKRQGIENSMYYQVD